MVRLQILSGRAAGTVCLVDRFPCTFGRAADTGVRIEEQGVWDHHFRIDFGVHNGFTLSVLKDAWALINGQPVECARLSNGDIIEAGSVKIQFALAGTRQYSHRFREQVTWFCLAGLCLGEVFLIYQLLF